MNFTRINHKRSDIGLKQFPGVTTLSLISILCFALVGCGSTPVSESRYASVQKQINEAEAIHASKVAGEELYEAQKKFEDARKADSDGKRKKALRLLKESELQAQLAETKAMRERAQKMLDEISTGLDTLEHEIYR